MTTTVTTITTPGAGTFTVPAGVTALVVEMWGRGADGGVGSEGAGGGGGGGAGYVVIPAYPVTPEADYDYTVAGVSAGNTTFGQNIDPELYPYAERGGVRVGNEDNGLGGSGYLGSYTGTIHDGGNGASNSGSDSGGGGASGSPSGAGANASGTSGGTGTIDGGDGGDAEQVGEAPGGGGGGSSLTARSGGPGQIRISYEDPGGGSPTESEMMVALQPQSIPTNMRVQPEVIAY